METKTGAKAFGYFWPSKVPEKNAIEVPIKQKLRIRRIFSIVPIGRIEVFLYCSFALMQKNQKVKNCPDSYRGPHKPTNRTLAANSSHRTGSQMPSLDK